MRGALGAHRTYWLCAAYALCYALLCAGICVLCAGLSAQGMALAHVALDHRVQLNQRGINAQWMRISPKRKARMRHCGRGLREVGNGEMYTLRPFVHGAISDFAQAATALAHARFALW